MKFRTFSLRSRLLVAVVFLTFCRFRATIGVMDQICVNVGYENLRDPPEGLFQAQSDGTYNENAQGTKTFCKHIFSGYKTNPPPPPTSPNPKALKSAASIGGGKYGSDKTGSATLAIPYHLSSIGGQQPGCRGFESTSNPVGYYRVQYEKKDLNGWLGFHVKINFEVLWAFIQVADEFGNAIGEFVTTPTERCDSYLLNAPDVQKPKEQQFLPCSAVALQEAKPSQSVVYTRKDLVADQANADSFLASPADVSKGIEMFLTWRLNEYYCNRHAKFRLLVYYAINNGFDDSTNPVTNYVKAEHWFYPRWYGAADIFRPSDNSAKLDCSTELKPGNNGILEGWIEKIELETSESAGFVEEREGENIPTTLYKSCRTYLTRLKEFTTQVSDQPSYGGRCEKMDEKKFKPQFYKKTPHSKSSVDVPHQCLKKTDATYPSEMQNYEEYVKNKTATRKALCTKNETCPTVEGFRAYLEAEKLARMYHAPNASHQYILKARAYHGAVFTVASISLISLSNFMGRFFKETFLTENIAGMRVWYFVHLACTVMVINLSVSGILSNVKVTRVWGRSWSSAGSIHRNMGWAWFGTFFLTAILGPYRPLHPRVRLVFIIAHSIVGYLLYFLGMATVLSSAFVPGSPSSTGCYKTIPGFDPFKNVKISNIMQHQVTNLVFWWLGLDMAFHTLMNFMQWKADRLWQVKRPHYFPTLLPVVRLQDRRSFKCFRYRALVLIFYFIALITIVTKMCQIYYDADWKGCDCGPLTCTHKSMDPFSVYKSNQCARHATLRENRKHADMEAPDAGNKPPVG